MHCEGTARIVQPGGIEKGLTWSSLCFIHTNKQLWVPSHHGITCFVQCTFSSSVFIDLWLTKNKKYSPQNKEKMFKTIYLPVPGLCELVLERSMLERCDLHPDGQSAEVCVQCWLDRGGVWQTRGVVQHGRLSQRCSCWPALPQQRHIEMELNEFWLHRVRSRRRARTESAGTAVYARWDIRVRSIGSHIHWISYYQYNLKDVVKYNTFNVGHNNLTHFSFV